MVVCFTETLRKYPPLPGLMRRSTQPFKVPGTNVIIEKGTLVLIPVYAIHHDSEYYPDPNTFNPDRFTRDALEKQPKQAFFPFGDGPRNCIAKRFGMMQTRIGLITMLRHFKFATCSSTIHPLEFAKTGHVLATTHEIVLKFERINK